MKKRYMWRAVTTSPYNVRALWLCADRKILAAEIERKKAEGYAVTEITKSGRYYVTDGNNDLDVKVLN